ncbi:MAG: hypothetical protein JXJ19_05095 [Elusimicrobia bacterium]|nr:hypothetical protein [Elusimicrobiota bacterium]
MPDCDRKAGAGISFYPFSGSCPAETRMKKNIRITMYLLAAAAVFGALFLLSLMAGAVGIGRISGTAAAILFAVFTVFQYFVLITHVRRFYLGPCGNFWKIALVLEPIGVLRLYYAVKHIRTFMEGSHRYAYTREAGRVKLKDLKLIVFERTPGSEKGYSSRICEITESPVYGYLKTGDRKVFEDYHKSGVKKGHKLKHPDPYPLEKFDTFYEKIRTGGYRSGEPYIRVRRGVISDGVHRACILHHLFGPEYEVEAVFRLDSVASKKDKK